MPFVGPNVISNASTGYGYIYINTQWSRGLRYKILRDAVICTCSDKRKCTRNTHVIHKLKFAFCKRNFEMITYRTVLNIARL